MTTRSFIAGEWAYRTKARSAPAEAERYEDACRSTSGDTGTKATFTTSPSAVTDGSPAGTLQRSAPALNNGSRPSAPSRSQGDLGEAHGVSTHGCQTGLRPVHVGRLRATRETQSAATRPDGSISRRRQDLHFVNRRYLRSSKRHTPHRVRVQMPVSPSLPYPRPCLNHDRGNPRNRKGTASAVPQTHGPTV